MKLDGMQKWQTIFSPSIWAKTNKSTHSLGLWHHLGGMQISRECSWPYVSQMCLHWARSFHHWHDSVQDSWFDHRQGSFPTYQHAQNCKTTSALSIFCHENKRKSNTSSRGWWGTTPRSVLLPCNDIGPPLWNPLIQNPAWDSAFWKFSCKQECQEGIHPHWSFLQWDALWCWWPQSRLGLYGLDWHRGKSRNSVRITPFKNMVFHLLKKLGNQLCNL